MPPIIESQRVHDVGTESSQDDAKPAPPFAPTFSEGIATACYISWILIFVWLGVANTGGLIALAILFGESSGLIIALMMSTTAHTADQSSKASRSAMNVCNVAILTQIRTYVGQATFVVGVDGLAGTPIAGALIEKHGFTCVTGFSAAVIMIEPVSRRALATRLLQ